MTTPLLLADKTLRAKTLRWSALLVALGLIGIWSLVVYLEELTALQATDPQLTAERYSRLLFVLGLANALIAVGAGGILGLGFYRALKAERFPPPGIRLMWDTRLRTGKDARRIALVGLALAVTIALGGIAFGAVMVKIAHTPVFSGPAWEAAHDGEGRQA
jgi:hypothetical protein